MFETTVVKTAALAPHRIRLLSVSLAAHTIAIVGAVAISVASVEFPKTAPDQVELAPSYQTVSVPPPLGNPNGGAKPAATPAQPKPAPAPKPTEITAPAQVPENVLNADAASSNETATGTGPSTGTVPGPVGVPWGDPNSVATDLDLPPATTTTNEPPKVYHVGGDVKAPRVVHRVEPRYPPSMVAARKGAVVRMRCTVDRHGAVTEATVVSSTFPAFNEAALDAMRQWRFAPGSLNGVAVDTVFELTVNFQVLR